MASAVARWRGWYGAHPLHLLAVLGALALAGYAAVGAAGTSGAARMLVWFLAAILVSDLLLQPFAALADRGLLATLRRVRGRRGLPRVPVLGSGLLLLVFFPVIVQQGEQTYVAATGLTMDPYLERWLLLSGAMFLISALGYALRLARARGAGTGRSEGPG
ncbi:MAG: hypothetical protein M3408_01665 [Actinomycetota bacterium]|nr:hypothetical protein [Actinomycetota bacterium]